LPLVKAKGNELRNGKQSFIAFGFNYSGRFGAQLPYSFASPRKREFRIYLNGMRQARRLGANTLRVYLQLFDFIHRDGGKIRIRRRARDHLRYVLAAAERLHLYLDLTGNLVWIPNSAPSWYDQMSAEQRWLVQARFWRGIARLAEPSSAVLCYELTSEPAITTSSPSWYTGSFGGLNFVQLVVKDAGESDKASLAREWITTLTAAIRSRDRRHLISVGLLPFTGGPFAPGNVADLLDVLIVHIYPRTGKEADALQTAQSFAAPGKPLILGETATLRDDSETQKQFLLDSRPYFDGFLSFYRSGERTHPATTLAEAIQKQILEDFLSVRSELLGGG
jgi:hypothetical protein